MNVSETFPLGILLQVFSDKPAVDTLSRSRATQ